MDSCSDTSSSSTVPSIPTTPDDDSTTLISTSESSRRSTPANGLRADLPTSRNSEAENVSAPSTIEPTNSTALAQVANGRHIAQSISQPARGPKKKDTPKRLEISRLPSIDDIRKAIPEEGIELKELARKFSSWLDHTNGHLFAQLVFELGFIELKVLVKPSAIPVDMRRIQRLKWEAERAAPPRPALLSTQAIKSELVGSVTITFSEPEEQLRGSSNILPERFSRVDYEQSATPSAYTAKHNRVHHRDVEKPRLHDSNAFQSLEEFTLTRDLTCYRIERQLMWNKKRDPSSYISAFGDTYNAFRRCHYLYHKSGHAHMGERIVVAVIDTKELVPATVRATLREVMMETRWDSIENCEKVERDVSIPIWVHKCAIPADGSPITPEQLAASGADIWISITEIRASNLRVPASRGHNYEWLACGRIPKARISAVWPFDGTHLYRKRTSYKICSKRSTEPWKFDWDKQQWVLDLPLSLKRASDSPNDDLDEGTKETTETGIAPNRSQNKRQKRGNDDGSPVVGTDNDQQCPVCEKPLPEGITGLDALRSVLTAMASKEEVEKFLSAEVERLFPEI